MEDRVNFAQAGPRLGNTYVEDEFLQQMVRHFIPNNDLAASVEQDLERFGGRVVEEFVEMNLNANVFEPKLEKYDAWGNKINKLYLSEGWRFFHRVSAEEGLIAIPYEENRYGQHARIYQAMKLLLFSANSGGYGCPLAMTDGCAYVLRDAMSRSETVKTAKAREELERAYRELISRDPNVFQTSGQHMTEKRGGSDVSYSTDTVAVKVPGGDDTEYTLHGYKWFTSATDSGMSLTLARVANHRDEDARKTPLSMFLFRMRKDDSKELNNIEIVRLKDKFGTKSLPTAELVLDGTKATLVSEMNRGVATIAGMLHITRYHNAIASVAIMRKMTALAYDFAYRRFAFGKTIIEHPLHIQTLNRMNLDTNGNLLFVLESSRLLGLIDAQVATEKERSVLRIITSLMKLFTAREGVRLASEGVECFGGVGVMENSQVPILLRDAQVYVIWEGTTNILALDLIRVVHREPKGIAHLKSYLLENLQQGPLEVIDILEQLFGFLGSKSGDVLEWNARSLAFNMSRVIITSLVYRINREDRNPSNQDSNRALFEHWSNRLYTEFQVDKLEGNPPALKAPASAKTFYGTDIGRARL